MNEKKKMGTGKKILIGIGVLFLLGVIANLGGDDKATENKQQEKSDQPTIEIENCDYNKVEIKAFEVGTDKLINQKLLEGCFEKEIVDKSLGLVEIKNSSGTVKVSYYIEKDPKILRFLDIKIGEGEASKWRANQGHDLFIIEKGETLNFIFGDRKKSKIKGTIKFMK